jgi:hypothetical protein
MGSRVARFFLVQYTETGKICIPITIKCTKLPQNILNGRKTDKRLKNIPTSFISRPSKIYPSRDFWFENMPFGKP